MLNVTELFQRYVIRPFTKTAGRVSLIFFYIFSA